MAEKRPLCKICGGHHWLRDGHVYPESGPNAPIPAKPDVTKSTRAAEAMSNEEMSSQPVTHADIEIKQEQNEIHTGTIVLASEIHRKYRKHPGRGGKRAGAGRPRRAR